MINEQVVKKEIVESKENIQIFYDHESEEKTIELNRDKRFIKEYTEIDIDIIVIQILNEDNVDKKYFLSPYIGKISTNLKGNSIYITQFPKGKNLSYSTGKITKISGYELAHNAATDKGSSGSPIFLENTQEVIGIHKQGSLEKLENYGNFLYPVIESIKSNNKIDNKKEDREIFNKKNNEKYIYKYGEYYIGEWLNGLRHVKGKLYYKNDNIKYEGGLIEDKYEGDGKYIWRDDEYYIGLFLYGLKHGKGVIYYKNGNIKYEGNFIKDKFEGDGKYYFENGEYYIGHFINGQRDGIGKLYYKNGNIKYEGDFKEDRQEGNGKFIWENDEYYEGQFLNAQSHRKRKEYYKDGNIKYDGDFIKDEYEGNGK